MIQFIIQRKLDRDRLEHLLFSRFSSVTLPADATDKLILINNYKFDLNENEYCREQFENRHTGIFISGTACSREKKKLADHHNART